MQRLQKGNCTPSQIIPHQTFKTTVCQVYVDEVIAIRPVLLVHEPQSMEEFVHQQQQALLLGEALGVQEHLLLSTYHPQLALAFRASLNRHVVDS